MKSCPTCKVPILNEEKRAEMKERLRKSDCMPMYYIKVLTPFGPAWIHSQSQDAAAFATREYERTLDDAAKLVMQ